MAFHSLESGVDSGIRWCGLHYHFRTAAHQQHETDYRDATKQEHAHTLLPSGWTDNYRLTIR
jgi:hypothetical protein